VVGQMLDYAANGSAFWPFEEIKRLHEESGASLTEIGVAPDGEEDYWEKVKTNLRAGKLRLLFVADKIPTELRRIIEFLNGQMQETEVYGVEIRYYLSEGISAFVPTLIGQTGEALQVKQQRSKQWNEQSVLAEIAKSSGEKGLAVAQKLLQTFTGLGWSTWWGKGKQYASVILHVPGTQKYLMSLYPTDRKTSVQLHFAYMPEELRSKKKAELEQIPGVHIPEDRIDKYPSFDLLLLQDQKWLDVFISIFKCYLEETI